jgi:alpha-glucosidase
LFVEHVKTGLPVNRPLVLNYPNDENTYNLNDEFMIGENILVAPIVKVGQTRRMVYLPEGKWIRFDNHKVYDGNQYVIVEAKLDECPIFIKYNSIIPTYSNTNIENPAEIVFECYGDKGEYKHYQDNGLDFNYEKGEYNIYKVSFNGNESNVELVYNGYDKYSSIKVNIIK